MGCCHAEPGQRHNFSMKPLIFFPAVSLLAVGAVPIKALAVEVQNVTL